MKFLQIWEPFIQEITIFESPKIRIYDTPWSMEKERRKQHVSNSAKLLDPAPKPMETWK